MLSLTTLLIRLCLGFIFFTSGLCKLTFGHFGQIIGPPDLINTLAEYDLGGFGYMIAISQVLIGMLVMTQRFSLLGLIAMVPMNACILGVTTAQGWTGTPYVNAFLLLLNLIALLYEGDFIKYVLGYQISAQRGRAVTEFPATIPALVAMACIILAMLFSAHGSIWVNVFASMALSAIAYIVFTQRSMIIPETIVLVLFFVFSFSLANANLLPLDSAWAGLGFILLALVVIAFISYLAAMFLLHKQEHITHK